MNIFLLFFVWNDPFLLVDQILILYCLFFSCKTRSLSSSFIFIVSFERCCGRIAGRSGLALNHGIVVHNGMIDSDYRGELGMILYNHSNGEYCKDWWSYCSTDYSVIHCKKVWLSHQPDTERGDKGFGSSGV